MRLDEHIRHISNQIQFLLLRLTMRKQVVFQCCHRKLALLDCPSFLVHINRGVGDRRRNVAQRVLQLHIFVCVNHRRLEEIQNRLLFLTGFVQHNVSANLLVGFRTQCAKQCEQFHRLLDARHCDIQSVSKSVILG